MNVGCSMLIQLIDMVMKPLPLGLLVIRIELNICVIRALYQTEVVGSLKRVSIYLGSRNLETYKIIATRICFRFILFEISRDWAVFQIPRLGTRGFSHHEQERRYDGYHKKYRAKMDGELK